MNTEELDASQRRKIICQIINRDGKVKVANLRDLFKTSEVTIRNDLTILEKEGLLERVHGGAISKATEYKNMSFFERQSEKKEEKIAIAQAAAQLVEDGQIIILNDGTTTYYIACALKEKKNLVVVTNSIPIAAELSGIPDHTVVLLGGNVNHKYSFTYGNDAINQLKKYKADKLFLCVDGISAENGLTIYHSEESDLNQLMIDRAYSSVVVADYKKIGRESFSNIAAIDAVDMLITNASASKDELEQISLAGVEVICV